MSEHQYFCLINHQKVETTDRTPTPAQLLAQGGFEPADDYILILRTEHGTRSLTSDDAIDLHGAEKEFFAFRSGTAYQITVNEHTIIWGEERIEIPELRRVANVPDDHELIWIREDQSNDILPEQGYFPLNGQGVEHLRTRVRPDKPLYEYFVGSTEYTTHEEQLSGAQIIGRIPDWNPANTLVLEGEGSQQDEPIGPTTVVVFKGRTSVARFTIAPPATFG